VVTSSVASSSMSIDVGELPTRRRGDVLSLLTDRRRGRLGEDGAAASGDHLLRALGHPCEDVEHEVRTACLVSLCAVSAGSMVNLTGLRTAICCPSGRRMCCSLARYGRPAGWASPEGSVRGESSGTCAGSKVPPGTRVLGRARPGPPRSTTPKPLLLYHVHPAVQSQKTPWTLPERSPYVGNPEHGLSARVTGLPACGGLAWSLRLRCLRSSSRRSG
jgi:hypothetical protein